MAIIAKAGLRILPVCLFPAIPVLKIHVSRHLLVSEPLCFQFRHGFQETLKEQWMCVIREKVSGFTFRLALASGFVG